MITVYLNNSAVSIEASVVLYDAMQQWLPGTQPGLAVAVNDVVIPREEWKNTALHNGDKIIIITAVQGG